MEKNTSPDTYRLALHQKGINMVDLMMWIVIAAILLAAAIQGVGYYRESVILYHLKNDALGAAANVKSGAAQDEGVISQSVVDAGLLNTKWSEGTTHLGKANDKSSYSITAGNPEIKKSVVYCSLNGITVVPNVDLATFTCGGNIVAAPPIGDGSGGGDPGDGSGDPGSGIPKPTGSLAGWGNMFYGQLASGPITDETTYGPFHGKTVTNLAKGNAGGCALADSILWCWDSTTTSSSFRPVNMQLSGPLLGKTVTDLSVGAGHACVVANGDGYCWGSNTFGELGNGTVASTTWKTITPAVVSKAGVLSGKTLKAIRTGSSGAQHTCAIDTNDKVYCWGKNDFGQLGIGTTATTTANRSPAAVNDALGALVGVTVSTVTLSSSGTCVLDTLGAAYCWGNRNTTATIGGTQITTPVRTGNTGILAGKSFTQINGVGYGVCVVSEGLHYCWGGGINNIGTLNSTHNAPRLFMVDIPAGTTVTKTTAKVLIMSDGKAYTYDLANKYVPMTGSTLEPFASTPITEASGQCIMYAGEPWCESFSVLKQVSDVNVIPVTKAKTPLDISSNPLLAGKAVTEVDAYNSHTCAIADDKAYCWGYNSWGNLGDGTQNNTRTGVEVQAPAGKAANIGTGGRFSCATFDGAPYCWGGNNYGQLGNGDGAMTQSLVPVRVAGVLAGKTVEKLTVGDSFACAFDTSNAVYCWGDNSYGQFGNGTTVSSSVPVLVNGAGVLSNKDITYLDAGANNTCAVANGTAYCWGSNEDDTFLDGSYENVLNPMAITSGSISGKTITSVQFGEDTGCALASDQTAHCWGANWWGEFGNGTTTAGLDTIQIGLTGVTALSIGGGASSVCAISSTGLSCWGKNSAGNLGNGTLVDALSPTAVDVSGILSGKTIKSLIVAGANTFVIYD
jgi:alpha-tubulin suppressor-like RCC1 family protein